MAFFSIDPVRIESIGQDLRDIGRDLSRIAGQVRAVRFRTGESAERINFEVIPLRAEWIQNHKEAVLRCASTLDTARCFYLSTENSASQSNKDSEGMLIPGLLPVMPHKSILEKLINKFREMWKDWTTVTPTEIDSIVFDENKEGQYGGDQMSLETIGSRPEDQQDYYDLIRRNAGRPDLTNDQLRHYLRKITSEGCGYVALVNTIFAHFIGREREFESTFGYPMRKSNGDLNFEKLLVDLHSSEDSSIQGGMKDYDRMEDGPEQSYDYWSDETGGGTSQYERSKLVKHFLSQHGVDVQVKTDADITINNIDNKIRNGEHVIIAFRYGNIYDENGGVHPIRGGHAMEITGVTEDGRYIVSSWGTKYYLDPKEVVTIDGHTTSMTYSTVSYP